MYAAVISMAYIILTEKMGEQNTRILFFVMECIILILSLYFVRKRKTEKSIVFLSVFFANVLILIFSGAAFIILMPLSLTSSCIYKIRALRSAKIETARDKFYINMTYFAVIPGELFFSLLIILTTWKDIFLMFF